MLIRIIRDVPGYVEMHPAPAGAERDLPQGLALSLVNDGYAELVRSVPAEIRETATGRRPGRPRKGR